MEPVQNGQKLYKFDTQVQYLKYKVLREVARQAWAGTLFDKVLDIPKIIVPGNEPTMRCCVYKERAILADRVQIAIGGDKSNPNVIEVIETACDECPMGGYEVTDACRGCLAHRCQDSCRKGAITFDSNQKAHIDKTKCVECGLCAKNCPYSAIMNYKRPCMSACKVKAISMNENKAAKIDNDKCISCGACVYMCPFGAISDKSFIVNAIDMIQRSENNTKYKVYAIVAPAIGSQFSYAKLGQVISGIKKLGFHTVVEAALGADMVAMMESKELAEKGDYMTSSCCPAFVDFIHKNLPDMVDNISTNLSPMATLGQYIKSTDPDSKVVFIGPCTAKKMEFQKESVRPYIDCVITFEELQALFDSKDFDIRDLDEDILDNASYFGRIFARSGGLCDAVVQALKEQNINDFELKAVSCDGIEACKAALLKRSKNLSDVNFIEGMACVGGCIGGAGCLTHGEKNKAEVDKYGREALEKTISEAVSVVKLPEHH
ncbi:MAG: 4Fe-4S dicluster domain-containing protein [Oscillospiraceae bacterium]